jgi:hypothetical protein
MKYITIIINLLAISYTAFEFNHLHPHVQQITTEDAHLVQGGSHGRGVFGSNNFQTIDNLGN